MHAGAQVRDLVIRDGRAVAVSTDAGEVDADLVVCAVDPRRLPALADHVRHTTPAIPPVVVHLGLAGDVPAMSHEVVLLDDPTQSSAPAAPPRTATAPGPCWAEASSAGDRSWPWRGSRSTYATRW